MTHLRSTDQLLLEYTRDLGRAGHTATPQDLKAIKGTFAYAAAEYRDTWINLARTAIGKKPIPRIFAKEGDECPSPLDEREEWTASTRSTAEGLDPYHRFVSIRRRSKAACRSRRPSSGS